MNAPHDEQTETELTVKDRLLWLLWQCTDRSMIDLTDDKKILEFVDKVDVAISAQKQQWEAEAYGRGYNTGFQKGKRIRLRPSKVAEQLRVMADKIESDNAALDGVIGEEQT